MRLTQHMSAVIALRHTYTPPPTPMDDPGLQTVAVFRTAGLALLQLIMTEKGGAVQTAALSTPSPGGAPRVSAPLPMGTAMVRMPSAISRTCARRGLTCGSSAWQCPK